MGVDFLRWPLRLLVNTKGGVVYYTPLRYPGGKGQLTPFIKLLFQSNKLLDGHYVEPYAGGAGVALGLLFGEYASHVHINDLNKSVYAFWHSVIHETEALCALIQRTEISMEAWREQKLIQTQAVAPTLLELGFSTFYLNRTNRSGILNAGVIGGKEQTGPWKIDARYNKEDLISRIKKIAQYRNRISIYNQDAADFIKKELPNVPNRSLVYLDPPYYVKGQDLYQNYYRHEDHSDIAILVSDISQRWIVSYDQAPEIRTLYKNFRSLVYGYHYSAANRYEGSEVIFFSKDLVIPSVDNPSKITARELKESQSSLVQGSLD